MKYKTLSLCLFLVGCGGALFLWGWLRTHAPARNRAVTYLVSWDGRRAADYLDRREVWWQYWPAAQMGHKTVCISCHTVVPYAMVRSSLSQALQESEMPVPQKVLMASVEARVGHWSEMAPFYPDSFGPGKAEESRATEAVLNAVILASDDAQHGHLRPITRRAFDEAWALEQKTGPEEGGWKWQNFGLAPFESAESSYLGAALLMLQVERAPDGYANEASVQQHLAALRSYLRRGYERQPLLNQIHILWLCSMDPALLTENGRAVLLNALRKHQRADGGWALAQLDPRGGLGWKARWKQSVAELVDPVQSDGYATGLVVLALKESGIQADDPMLTSGVHWLKSHQESDGSWQAQSLNARRDPNSDVGRFMRDAATAYALMALESTPAQSIEKTQGTMRPTACCAKKSAVTVPLS